MQARLTFINRYKQFTKLLPARLISKDSQFRSCCRVTVAYCLELEYHHHPTAFVVAGSAFVDASVAAADVLAAFDDAAVVGVADAGGVVAAVSVVVAAAITISC